MGVQLIIFPPRLNDFHRVVTYYIKLKKKLQKRVLYFIDLIKKKSVGQYNQGITWLQTMIQFKDKGYMDFGPSDILKIESYMDTYKSTNS